MRGVGKALLAATLIAGTTIAATAPAQADRGSTAVVAGLIGLGVGAAIASDHHRGYYAEPVQYYSAPAYYGGYDYNYAPAYYGSYGYSYGYDRGRHYGRDRNWRDDRNYDRHDRHDRRDHDRDRDWRR
jgi:hypothetical protein